MAFCRGQDGHWANACSFWYDEVLPFESNDTDGAAQNRYYTLFVVM